MIPNSTNPYLSLNLILTVTNLYLPNNTYSATMGANQSKPRKNRRVPKNSRVSAPHSNNHAAGRGECREENGRGYADDYYPASRGGPPSRYADDYNQPGRGCPPPYAEDYNPYSAGRGRSPYAGNPYMGGRGREGNRCAMADGNCTDDLYPCGDDYYDDDDDYYDDDYYPAGPVYYPPGPDREEYGCGHPDDNYAAGRGREDHGAQPPRREKPRPAGGKKKRSMDQGRRALVRRK